MSLPFGIRHDELNAPMSHVYVLVDPGTGKVFYVGSAFNLRERMNAHLRRSGQRNGIVGKYVASMQRRGVTPRMDRVASFYDKEDAKALEGALIRAYRKRGIVNVRDSHSYDDRYYANLGLHMKDANG